MTSLIATHGLAGIVLVLALTPVTNEELPVGDVEGQPLGANIGRLRQALELLGRPLPTEVSSVLDEAERRRDSRTLQTILDPHVLFLVHINPESRVKVKHGPAPARLQEAGYTPILVKVINESTVTQPLGIRSQQAGPVYAGSSRGILARQAQTELKENENTRRRTDRFLDLEMYTAAPMTRILSGLEVEYAIALVYASESGKREATIAFDVGQGTEDLGFRGETPVLFDIRPAIPVRLSIHDEVGNPTVARLEFTDSTGHIYPPQAKRLAPDFFFQKQIYRRHGDTVLLPPGTFTVTSSRGPEYRTTRRSLEVSATGETSLDVRLKRWVEPRKFGFYSGDHHIHGAGCSHYTFPTEGVRPDDMFLQVKGEGLNVGCVLTWGPCFDFQRQFFTANAHPLSEPFTVLKYDLEISGFGSQALGHVCLLDLKDQTYPGSNGTKNRGWPTWTTPVLAWAKLQGAVTGYAHSASGLQIDPQAATHRLFTALDSNGDDNLDAAEAIGGLLPAPFAAIEKSGDGRLSRDELRQAINLEADHLPNLVVPEMNGVGAMEICVSAVAGVCDFISAMDTARIQEWNTWYHLLNCGFPIKVSGETDFPCMSSTRVGQGRVYVQLGDVEHVDFTSWCRGLAAGRSYVSDGFAHALRFTVGGQAPGFGDVVLDEPKTIDVQATVAFSPEIPLSVAHGGVVPPAGRRIVGDTVNLHGSRPTELDRAVRRVELVVNGEVRETADVPADGKSHEIRFSFLPQESSWVALRQFPQLHTNPVNVLVAGKRILVSRKSALWCVETIRLLWTNRAAVIAPEERQAAKDAFQRAEDYFLRLAEDAAEGKPARSD